MPSPAKSDSLRNTPAGRWLAITLGVGLLALIAAVVVWVVYPDVLIDAFIRLLPVVR